MVGKSGPAARARLLVTMTISGRSVGSRVSGVTMRAMAAPFGDGWARRGR